MIHSIDILIKPQPEFRSRIKEAMADSFLSYGQPERISRRLWQTPIKRAADKLIWLPEGSCLFSQHSGRQTHFTFGPAMIRPDGNMQVRIDLCAAWFELIQGIPWFARFEGYRSWLKTHPDRPMDVPKGLAWYMHEDVRREPFDEYASRFLCTLNGSERDKQWALLRQYEEWVLRGRCPYLLGPAEIIFTLQSYIYAICFTFGYDPNDIRISGADLYYQWQVPSLRNFMPGVSEELLANAERGIRVDEAWVEELDMDDHVKTAAYMLDPGCRLDGELLRLKFHLTRNELKRAGIIDISKLYSAKKDKGLLNFKNLVSELQRLVKTVTLPTCLNEIDIIADGGVHALRNLYLFYNPHVLNAYLEHFTASARAKEVARLSKEAVCMLEAEQPQVPDAARLKKFFSKATGEESRYCFSKLEVKRTKLNAIYSKAVQ